MLIFKLDKGKTLEMPMPYATLEITAVGKDGSYRLKDKVGFPLDKTIDVVLNVSKMVPSSVTWKEIQEIVK